MARLVDCDPAWVTHEGRRVGVSFKCVACADDQCRTWVYFDPPLDPGQVFQPAWARTGDTFETLTLTPSIRVRMTLPYMDKADDPPYGVHWHGFVPNAVVATWDPVTPGPFGGPNGGSHGLINTVASVVGVVLALVNPLLPIR